MAQTTSTYGKTGAVGLVVAGIVWAVAVALGESGSSPDALTQGLGYVGLALLLVGMIALSAMLVGTYASEDL